MEPSARTLGRNPLCVALDVPSAEQAIRLANRLEGHVGYMKIGLQLFCKAGPSLVRTIVDMGHEVFLDLKFMDIPNTVHGAVASVAELGASIVNVHALGGVEMMSAAKRSAANSGSSTRVVAVTILTSLDQAALEKELRVEVPVGEEVRHLSLLAQGAGLDGVVCSPEEAAAVRSACGPDFMIITPGVRPSAGASSDDQRRVATPAEAIRAGADILVVGRPITQASDPVAASEAILLEIEGAMG